MQSKRMGWVSVTEINLVTIKFASFKESFSLHVTVGCRIHFFLQSKFITRRHNSGSESQKHIGGRMWCVSLRQGQLYCMNVRERPAHKSIIV